MDAFRLSRRSVLKTMALAWALIVTLTCPLSSAPADDSSPFSPLQKALSPHVGPQDAVMVVSSGGEVLARINADMPLIPASTLKILTALAALKTLGAEFRFNTDFLTDAQNNLKIKGYGDPLLVSERLQTIAAALAGKLSQVNHLILDDSFFKQPLTIPGRGASSQPYDAPNGALCVNFNTVAFTRHNGRWTSGEPQTPLLPFVIPKIETTGLSAGRITLAADSDDALQYTGHLFRYFLNQAGIKTSGAILRGNVSPGTDRLIWQYRSTENLGQAVRALLEFSNNFIANQILLVMGAHVYGAPATMEKGLSVLNTFYKETLDISSGSIVESSGISRRNRMSAQAMITVLDRFQPYHKLMRQKGGQFYKTGHLKGIRTRAGFLMDRNGELCRFAVLVNTPGKTTRPIMQIIERHATRPRK